MPGEGRTGVAKKAGQQAERDEERTSRIEALRERATITERANRLALEQRMAIEVKLDIVEGAISVLDGRTRAHLSASERRRGCSFLAMQGAPMIHDRAQVLSNSPLRVRTPPGAWEYAVSFGPAAAPFAEHAAGGDGFVTHLDVEVVIGRIGTGWTNQSGSVFIEERYLDPGRVQVRVPVPPGITPGVLVFRNADRAEPSEFILHNVDAVSWASSQPPHQVRVASRDFSREPVPEHEGTGVFEDATARAINVARIAWLEAADLPVRGKRVIDVGCGVGHFVPFYLERGCTVAGIDGREENIRELRARLPQVEGHVGDVQCTSLRDLGEFDIVHCFGLLYHLDSPVAALRHIHDACGELLVLETMVCDSSRPVVMLADESKSRNQALAGLGCRPSPAYIALALSRIGFPFVYGSTAPPHHPDFLFAWKDNLDVQRDGHNLRCMFVASRRAVRGVSLVSLLDK